MGASAGDGGVEGAVRRGRPDRGRPRGREPRARRRPVLHRFRFPPDVAFRRGPAGRGMARGRHPVRARPAHVVPAGRGGSSGCRLRGHVVGGGGRRRPAGGPGRRETDHPGSVPGPSRLGARGGPRRGHGAFPGIPGLGEPAGGRPRRGAGHQRSRNAPRVGGLPAGAVRVPAGGPFFPRRILERPAQGRQAPPVGPREHPDRRRAAGRRQDDGDDPDRYAHVPRRRAGALRERSHRDDGRGGRPLGGGAR